MLTGLSNDELTTTFDWLEGVSTAVCLFPFAKSCFTVDTVEGQTSNDWHATGWGSIYLVEQNLTGNTLDLLSQAGDSSNIL